MGLGALGRGAWSEWASFQQQQMAKKAWLFQLLAEHQKVLFEKIATMQAQTNMQLWDQVSKTLGVQSQEPGSTRDEASLTHDPSAEDDDCQ